MPILTYPEDAPSLQTFRAVDYTPAEEEPSPETGSVIGAAFRQDNIVGSMLNNRMAGVDTQEREEGFTSDAMWSELEGTPYAESWERFADLHNRRAFEAMKSQIDTEAEDRRTLAAGGWRGVAASLGAAVLDVPSLLPGGALVRGATTGATVARTALSAGAAGALAAGVSEFALQTTQVNRPLAESALNVGGGAVLGGLLGAGVGALFSRAERAAAVKTVEERIVAGDTPGSLAEVRAGIAEAQSAGAAAVDVPVLEDYNIAGTGARAVGRSLAPLNPLLRAAQSPSAVHRSVVADLAETGFYVEKNVRGEGNIAVESAVKFWDRGALTKALQENRAAFDEARKSAMPMSRAEFHEAVSRAMRRGDESENPAVARAARAWRSALFDPLKNEAIDVGIFPADVTVKSAVSYLTRIWNPQRLNAGEARFKAIVRPWLDEQLAQLEFKADEIRIGNRVVEADKARETFERAAEGLQRIEDSLAERSASRARRVSALNALERDRLSVLSERAPRELVKLLRGADEASSMVDAVREARKGMRSASRKQSYAERYPVLAIIKGKGGVRVGSVLDGELRAMGVNPTSHPGMFRKSGGIGDVDNFFRGEDDILANLPDDGAGYVDRRSILAAISDELAGNPLRTDDEILAAQALENMDRVASEWLASVGLPENASVREVREFINRVMQAERNTVGLDQRIARFERDLEQFDAVTDKIMNDRTISDSEVAVLRDQLNKIEAELDNVGDLANASPRVSLVVDYASTKRDLFKGRLNERTLAKRVEALKRVEAQGRATPEMLAELNAKEIDIERLRADLQGKQAKVDKLEPMVPKVKQELPEFVSEADRQDYLDGIINDVFRQLTSRANQGMPSYDMVMSTRGPMKERTFNIPDELIEEFLENDIEMIARRYARVMAADVELARLDRRLGGLGKPDLKGQIDRVSADFQRLREDVMASDLEPAAKEAELMRLAKREKSDVEDVAGLRDLLRGQYRVESQHTNFARVLRAANTFNFVRILGGVLVSSLGDVVRPAMVNGMGRYMREGIAPLITNLDAVKLSVDDAKLLGAVTERTLQSRLATLAELADPYSANSPFERFIDNVGATFSKMTLLPFWNDMQKSISSVLTQNRILKNATASRESYAALADAERAYMGFVGIDEDMARRIAAQFDQFGQVEGNVHIASLERWTDDGARRAYAAAVNKDVDGTIVTKGVGDAPLGANTPIGRAFLQFKTFALASNQRVLMRGLQEGQGKFITGMVAMSTVGMMVYWLKQVEAGRPVSNNVGTWMTEGLDRSGIFSVGFEINNVYEALGGVGFYDLASRAGRMIDPAADQRQPASRFVTRGQFGAALGPSYALGQDTVELLGLALRGARGEADMSPGDVTTAMRMIPFLTLPYWRWIIEGGFGLQDGQGFEGIKPELKQMVD